MLYVSLFIILFQNNSEAHSNSYDFVFFFHDHHRTTIMNLLIFSLTKYTILFVPSNFFLSNFIFIIFGISLMQYQPSKRTNHKFTYEEDRMLRKLVKDYGESNWDEIASFMKGRNKRQCHDRWYYYLSPKINNQPWTDEEDQRLIKECYNMNGKWVQISKKFKGRTDTQIKNRWNLLKKMMFLPKINRKAHMPKCEEQEPTESISQKDKEETNEGKEQKPEDNPEVVSGVLDKLMSLFNENEKNSFDANFDFLT